MEPISKENEFAKISTENNNLVCTSKSWYINLSYYFTFKAPQGVKVIVSPNEIRKLKIQSTKPLLFVFILLALLSLGAGILYWKNPIGDVTIQDNNNGLTVGLIIAAIFLGIAFLFYRSRFGKLKILSTSIRDGWLVLYASPDVQEIRSLKQTIENNLLNPVKIPPRMAAVPPQ